MALTYLLKGDLSECFNIFVVFISSNFLSLIYEIKRIIQQTLFYNQNFCDFLSFNRLIISKENQREVIEFFRNYTNLAMLTFLYWLN